MTTITAVPTADGAGATLTITPSTTIDEVRRLDGNGSRRVRVPAGTFPRSTPLTVTDWEAGLRGTVTWTAGTGSAQLAMPTTQPWIILPLRPTYSMEVEQVTSYDAGRQSLATAHQVIDRTDPLFALGRLASRQGRLTILCRDYPTARILDQRLDMAGVAMLKQADHQGLDMYFVPTATSVQQDGATEDWHLQVDYTEITSPTSPITEGAWTFGTLSTSFASFANVTADYDDYEGLAINDQVGVI